MKVCAFDLETAGADSDFGSCSTFDDTGGRYFTDPTEAIDYLRRRAKSGYTLAAHNAEYDVVNLLWKQGEDVTVHVHQSQFTCAYWRYAGKRRNVQVWDTLRLSAGLSLDDLGRAVFCLKYPTPQRLRGIDPDRYEWLCEQHGIGECVECYNVRDAEIVYRFLTLFDEWVTSLGLKLKRTLPSLALDLWSTFDPGMQQVIRSRPARDLAREAYHGGRCEPFMLGRVERVYTYDRRMQYAAILHGRDFPDCRELRLEQRYSGPADFAGVEGVVRCTVYQEPRHIPTLGAVIGRQLIYGVGTFTGTWTAPELRAFLSRGGVLLETHDALWGTKTVRPFITTALALIERREAYRAAQSPLELLPKMLGNALAGRLGMEERQERHIIRRWTPGLSDRDVRGWALESTERAVYLTNHQTIPRAAPGANVLWAAYVTAYGRLQLLEDMEAAGAALTYCDTDAVHSTAPLPTYGDFPGQLRDTGEFDVALYLGPKLYRLESFDGAKLVRAKGVPRRYADDYLTSGRVDYQTSIGVVQALASRHEPGSWVDVERKRHLGLATRHVVNPSALSEPDQVSETEPLLLALDGRWGRDPRVDDSASR